MERDKEKYLSVYRRAAESYTSQMEEVFFMHEKSMKIVKGGDEKEYTYYVKKQYSEEFGCDMYAVGVKTKDEKSEIKDFSPDEKEAVRLCDYLYDENVSVNNLFLQAEEFIVNRRIYFTEKG